MQEHDTFPGKVYAVTCASGCTITDNKGRTLGECEAGKQALVVATSDKLLTSASALVTETFKCAPAKLMALGLLGGGATNTLPAGYIAADWLGTDTGEAYITVPLNKNKDQTLKIETEHYTTKSTVAMMEGLNDKAHVGAYSGAAPGYLFVYFNWASAGQVVRGAWNTHVVEIKHEPTRQIIYHPNGERVIETTRNDYAVPTYTLFRVVGSNHAPWTGRKRTWKAWLDGKLAFDLVPAIAPDGQTCMYNIVKKESYYNIGTQDFIVGLTLAQARNLSNLPATGGALTISLPSNWQGDEGVVSALATAEANGWVFTYQTYESEAGAASTFALRRIYVRKTQNENGQYIDADGTRWYVEWCAGMIGAEPTEHGYEPFRSVDAAVAYWELEPWVDPEAEKMLQGELLTNDNTND